MLPRAKTFVLIFFWAVGVCAWAGPYTEPGINAYVDPNGNPADPTGPNAAINPIFRGWADDVATYEPSGQYIDPWWKDPQKALGPATGDKFDIVSLGDLEPNQLGQGIPPGQITLLFGDPCDIDDANHIRNNTGYDFAVFENGFVSLNTTPGGSVTGQMFTELGFVEVSSNGTDFVRFPSVSLTPALVGGLGTIEVSDVYNLAGKHPNAYGVCMGTPFDLAEIADDPNILSGVVDINNIAFVRIVDIPGSGHFHDRAAEYIDPNSYPQWQTYPESRPVYDAWVTTGSGGFDLEAIGVLKPQQYQADINLDGVVNWRDFAILSFALHSRFGDDNWVKRADLARPRNWVIDSADVAVFAQQWLSCEQWANN